MEVGATHTRCNARSCVVSIAGGGPRQCASETRPYTERTLSVTTTLARFTPSACPSVWRCVENAVLRRMPHARSRQGAGLAPLFHGERLGPGAGWCITPSPIAPSRVPNRRMAEISRHHREARRQTENTNFCLNDGNTPAYFPAQ
jgi:hypothetical protein